jgi:hypothetical protein
MRRACLTAYAMSIASAIVAACGGMTEQPPEGGRLDGPTGGASGAPPADAGGARDATADQEAPGPRDASSERCSPPPGLGMVCDAHGGFVDLTTCTCILPSDGGSEAGAAED